MSCERVFWRHVFLNWLLCYLLLPALSGGLITGLKAEHSVGLTRVSLTHLDYTFSVANNEQGVPQINWTVYRSRPEKVVTTAVEGVVLENETLRAVVIPSMGRLHSLIHRATGKESLFINPIAVPLGAKNDTGFWMTWGGIEHVMPRGEHGTSHALKWEWVWEEAGGMRVGVRMSCREPLTGLRHEVCYRLGAEQPYLETEIRISNPSAERKRFSHWTTATLAPGGQGEVSERTEIIVPAEQFVPDDRDFNHWMIGMVGPTRTAPIRFVGSWKDIGDLMTSPLKQGYYAVYSHETGQGVVRTFSLNETPGFDIWGWGYPTTPKRQREFTRSFPSNGYIEFWNGNVHGFGDDELKTIAGRSVVSWIERISIFSSDNRQETPRELISSLGSGNGGARGMNLRLGDVVLRMFNGK